VVAGVLEAEAQIAADSRETLDKGGYDDNDCKISNYSGKLIYATEGLRSGNFTVKEKSYHWDSHRIAKQSAAAAIKLHSAGLARAAAEAWRKQATSFFTKILKMDPQGFVRYLQSRGLDDHFTAAVFAGIENNQARAFCVYIVLKHTSNEPPSIDSEIREIPQKGAITLGFHIVVNEFQAGKIPLYKQEQSRWVSQMQLTDPHDYYFQYWKQLVVWSVEFAHNYPHGELVGGPIDVAKITPSGVQWLSRKASCKEVE
jgi:hypothetical protein